MRATRRPDPERFEKTARGVARGRSIREAALRAGFSRRSKWIYTLSSRPEFLERVETLKREGPLIGGDLEPVLLALMEGARDALNEGSGPGWSAAARMLAEAARIKKGMPDTEREDASYAWAVKWGPED